MSMAIVIPAQESNKYSTFGDLAPFGDTSMLQWKIAQCKGITGAKNIFISSDSSMIQEIAQKESIGYIDRKNAKTYTDILLKTIEQVPADTVLWTNPTAPFISSNDYKGMIEKFYELKDHDSMLSVNVRKDYVYFMNNRLNFGPQLSDRQQLEPVKIATNGCYIISKDNALKNQSLYGENPFLYELDYLASIEIKDMYTYQISTELISAYFKRELDV